MHISNPMTMSLCLLAMLYWNEDPCVMVDCGVFIVTARGQRALMRLSTRARHTNTTYHEHTHTNTHTCALVFTSI